MQIPIRVLTLLLLLSTACTPDESEPADDFEIDLPPVCEAIDLYDVRIRPVVPSADPKLDERMAWAVSQIELGLARIPAVVPHLGEGPVPPGLDTGLTAERHYRLTLAVEDDVGSIELCEPDLDSPCIEFDTPWTPGAPEAAVDILLAELAAHWDRDYDEEQLDEPVDDYIRKIVGRAMAAHQGLRAPAERLGDRRSDPVARAIFLNPGLVSLQWLAARTEYIEPERRLALLRRGQQDNDIPVHRAAHAWANTAVGEHVRAARLWASVRKEAPGDARFLLPTARAALRAEMPELADAALTALGLPSEEAARLRVELADESKGGAPDQLLAEWADAAPDDPRPIQRRIDLRLTVGNLEEARTFIDDLEKRGEERHALELELAIAVNLDDSRAARKAARKLEVPEPGPDAPTLAHMDEQTARLDERLAEQTSLQTELSDLQNRFVGERFRQRDRCTPELNALKRDARELGARLRETVQAAKTDLRALQALRVATTVAPVLDPVREQRTTDLTQAVRTAALEYQAAVAIQKERLEWPSRSCG